METRFYLFGVAIPQNNSKQHFNSDPLPSNLGYIGLFHFQVPTLSAKQMVSFPLWREQRLHVNFPRHEAEPRTDKQVFVKWCIILIHSESGIVDL
jgi:hypothetical protein